MYSLGFEFCRAGSRGGGAGARLPAGGGAGAGELVPSPRRTGGLGRFDVSSPVVFTRYGTGGGFGLLASSSAALASACCCWMYCCGMAAPIPCCTGAELP